MFDYFNIDLMASDKALHFKYGFCYSFLGVVWWPFYILGFAAGVAKELWDMQGHGDASLADLLFTFRGAALGVVLAFSIRLFLKWFLHLNLSSMLVHIPILHRYI